ncbi:MAG: hypothetical protein AAF353_00775, partial [Pseudomonadota bacterium]
MRTLYLTAPGGPSPEIIQSLSRIAECALTASNMGQPKSCSLLYERIQTLCHDILESYQASWFHVRNIPEVCEDSFFALPPNLGERLTTTLKELNDRSDWVLADPVFSLLLPHWELPRTGTLCVLHIPHPFDVATRLQKKWRFPLAFGVALWEHYIKLAIRHSDGYHRVAIQGSPRPESIQSAIARFQPTVVDEMRSELQLDEIFTDPNAESVACSDTSAPTSVVEQFVPVELLLGFRIGSLNVATCPSA